MKKVKIYSDGWARPNPWAWGYGVVLKFWEKVLELSGFEETSTNNRMELTWAIKWLEALKEPCEVDLYTDSSYVVNGIEKGWAEKWKANNWMRTKSEKAINYDLWEKLLVQTKKHKINFHWVKGHNGHIENERCDDLATEEILKNSPHPTYPLRGEEQEKNKQNKIKIEKEWDECRKCGTPVIKAKPKKKNTKNKSFYYDWFLTCSNCKTNYFVEEGKVYLDYI